MKSLISLTTILMLLSSSAAYAGLFDGQPTDPAKRARPGGYDEQVANKKSLLTPCNTQPIRDGGGNVIGHYCG